MSVLCRRMFVNRKENTLRLFSLNVFEYIEYVNLRECVCARVGVYEPTEVLWSNF